MPAPETAQSSHAIVIGAGLAGLVATAELVAAGKTVTVLEQESEANLGGQAWWSFGGLFLVDTPEQRRMGVKDSLELARQDWFGAAGFDRPEDAWGRQWAESYLQFAAGEKRAWLRERGVTGLTIKKRGVRLDDDELRRQLRIGRKAGDGAQATVILTRVAGQQVVLVVDAA